MKNKKQKTPTSPPANQITVVNPRWEPPAAISRMDAHRIHSILTSAEQGYCHDLFVLYRDILLSDSHIQGELAKRKLAVLGDQLTVQPWDQNNPADCDAATAVEAMLLNTPSLETAYLHLLDATIWPVALAETVYAPADPSTPEAGRRYRIEQAIPVPHHLLDFRQGEMHILDVDPNTGYVANTSRPADPNRYLIHRGHLLSIPDRFGGPMRSLIFLWLFSAMSRHWWARYLERYGSPFIVGKYQAGDESARQILESALSYAIQLGGLVITDNASVELKEAARSSGDAFSLFADASRREISRLILGQTLSAEAQSTGLGSGVANEHGAVRRDIRRYDALALGKTIRSQLVLPWMRYNAIPGRPPTIIWAEDTSEDAKRTGELLGALNTAGLEPVDDALPLISEKIGFGIQRKPQIAQPAILSAAQEVGATAFFRRERQARLTGF